MTMSEGCIIMSSLKSTKERREYFLPRY